MPAAVTGGTISGRGGGIKVIIEPPVEFILKQAGAFSRSLVTDMDELFRSFAPVLAGYEEEQFSSAGRGAWPPLAESTVRQKGSSEIMVDTGALKASLTDPFTAMTISGVTAEYGTDVEYAHYHQDGGSVPGRPPQRQLIPDPFPTEWRRGLEMLMVKWINDIASRTFGRI